jgi:cytochrome c
LRRFLTASACFLVASLSLAAQSNVCAEDAVDLAAAQRQFMNSCGVCHTVEPKAEIRQGPNLRSVVGRTAGTLGEFPTYSDALKKAGAGGLVWNEETLEKWIAGAADFIPGTMMPYSQPDAGKRKLIITYLKSLSGSTQAATSP